MNITQVNIPFSTGQTIDAVKNQIIIIAADAGGKRRPQGQSACHMDHGPVKLLFEQPGLGRARTFLGGTAEIIISGLENIHKKKGDLNFKPLQGHAFQGIKLPAQKIGCLTAQLFFIYTNPVINVRLSSLGQRPNTSHGIHPKDPGLRMPADQDIGTAQIVPANPFSLP